MSCRARGCRASGSPSRLAVAVHRRPSQCGDVEKAARVFAINEMLPVMEAMKGVNDWLGQEVIRFNPYALLKDE